MRWKGGREGRERSDIWAFGCVLYEMLTGRRAFEGEDVSDTLAAVLRGEPDWTALPAATPAPARRLLKRCIAKDRTRRLSDAAAARLDLDEAQTGWCRLGSRPRRSPRTPWRSKFEPIRRPGRDA